MEFPLPHPLCGDCDDWFVRKSVLERLPDILDSVVMKAPQEAERLSGLDQVAELAKQIRSGEHRIESIDNNDGGPDWTTFCQGREGKLCTEVEWWFLENYAYRLIMKHVNYFSCRVDPFSAHKRQALEAALPQLAHADWPSRSFESFHAMLCNALWGNQVDLSFSSGQVVAENQGRHLVLDESTRCWESVFEDGMDLRIVYILDNCGSELLNDLLFIHWILAQFPNATCVIHSKAYPVFVSDAIESDVVQHIHALASLSEPFQRVSRDLLDAIAKGRAQICSHEFYNSPLPFWEAPEDLKALYKASSLTVTKGDANYRRLLDDRCWPLRSSFQRLMSYWESASLLSLRTCKSPVAVGIPLTALQNFPSPDWLVNGNTGLVSFYRSS